MSSTNRANRIEALFKSLKKHFKPLPGVSERSVLEHLVYACCLEDARSESADEAFAKLQQSYFDWNEVRVTTVAELSEALSGLPNPAMAANRIKRNLQAIFESRYSFDIEDLRKMNLGKAIEVLEKWGGNSKFVVAYVSQHALGGHAIPLSHSVIEILRLTEVISDAEADKGQAPGIDRAVAKSKGLEFASLIHQMAAEHHIHPKNAAVLAVFKDMGVTGKRKPPPPPPPPPKRAPEPKADAEKTAGSKKAASKVEAAPAASKSSKTPAPKKPATKKPAESKKIAPAKKTKPSKPAKPVARKTSPPKKTKPVAAKKQTKRKPK